MKRLLRGRRLEEGMYHYDYPESEYKRGKGSTKSRYLRHIIGREGVEFVCLQETKSKEVTQQKCCSLWGSNRIGWLHHEGANGGGCLLSIWYEDAFSYKSHVMRKGFIVVTGNYRKLNLRCAIVNVYAACNMCDKKMLWEELSSVKRASQVKVWCICGDFNAIRNRSERKGIRERADQAREIEGFNGFIDTNVLWELPLVGKKFTWFKANGSAKSRLDRVLVSEDWLDKWPMCKQYVQNREVSDHCAIVVKSMVKDWGPKPFRSIDAWLLERGFHQMIKDKWGSYDVQGGVFQKIKLKLKCLKEDLKV